MSKSGKKLWLRILLWATGVPMAMLLCVLISLYIPGTLNYLAGKILPDIEKTTGMKIEVDNLRLTFPMRLQVDKASIVQQGDTMLRVQEAQVDVAPLSLLLGRLNISNAQVLNASYHVGGADSLYVAVKLDSIGAAASMNLAFDDIDVKHADLNGAHIRLLIGTDTTSTPTDTTAAAPLALHAERLSLRNVSYEMRLAQSNDTMATYINEAVLRSGEMLTGPKLTLSAAHFCCRLRSALYGKCGAQPLPGLDPNLLTLTDGMAQIDSLTMIDDRLRVPVTKLRVSESCGLTLAATGVYAMDSTQMRAEQFKLRLGQSTLCLDASMGLSGSNPAVVLQASANIFAADVATALPQFAPFVRPLPSGTPLRLGVKSSGHLDQLHIDSLRADMAGIFTLSGQGAVQSLSNLNALQLDASMRGSLINPAPVNALLPKASGLRLPSLALQAEAHARGRNYRASLTARTAQGSLALNGLLRGTAPAYQVEVTAKEFPVQAFMPGSGLGPVTASLTAKGRGVNPLLRSSTIDASFDLHNALFNGRRIGNLNLTAQLDTGNLQVHILSQIPAASGHMALLGSLSPQRVRWTLNGRLNNLNLRDLGLTDSVAQGAFGLTSRGMFYPRTDSIFAMAALRRAELQYGAQRLATDTLGLRLRTGAHMVKVNLGNPALNLEFNSPTSPTQWLNQAAKVANMASRMVSNRRLQVDSLLAPLPHFTLKGYAGQGNLLNSFLANSGLSFQIMRLQARKDSLLNGSVQVIDFRSGEDFRLDTITAQLYSQDDALCFDIDADNRPGTLDEFAHICLKAEVYDNKGTIYIEQRNVRNEVGYSLGLKGLMPDSTLAEFSLTPLSPIIGYKPWKINDDNFLTYNFLTKRLGANIDARSAESRIQLTANPNISDNDSIHDDDIHLNISDIHLQDWLKLNPFAPPIAGDVNAALNLKVGRSKADGSGTLMLKNLSYGKQRMGDYELNLNLSTAFSGLITAQAKLKADGRQVATLQGSLNDTTRSEPMMLALGLTQLPLRTANPFLPREYAQLSGYLSGNMMMTGSLTKPVLNGAVRFRDASVNVGMMGSSFRFDTISVPVDSNVVRFNNYRIYGSNANPLSINGHVSMQNPLNPQINLNMGARNIQVINSKKGRGVQLYGRGFMDVNVDVKGNMDLLRVDADLAILPQTAITYQLDPSANSIMGLQDQSDNLIRFVNFEDTTGVMQSDSLSVSKSIMVLQAFLDIQQGSTITVDLSADGHNRAQVKGYGILDYSLSPVQPDGRLTGRFTINSGFVRYTPPVISEKNFTFNPGSYVEFNGPILNPILNIHAIDQMKANVATDGENSRMVAFDVGLNVTGTLERMDVGFDLAAPNDITVQNELLSLSASQRASQAMNMLLYGIYTGQSAGSNANISGNMLYGFLTARLNSWAANTIKGIDLSFGMDQLNQTRNGLTNSSMQYSYTVSKSFLNDRFKLVVGGNYSANNDTDGDDNIAENLISDVSFEWMLNQTGSMYLKIFRHTGYESILEGEVTQTGLGFVMRRKVRRLEDIFLSPNSLRRKYEIK